ncbi:MAG TPA: SPFH domain-containing protein [Candidatus Eremiobacteraceae bacterium]|nr:SPFH domain-containing protein [Candidatus Eremiobacteraceae bacterium]
MTLLATGFFSAAVGIVIFDIYAARQLRLLLTRTVDDSAVLQTPPVHRPFDRVRWKLARRLATIGCLPLLLAFCIVVVPDGFAGVRISQIWGARAGTLYPGLHLVTPLVDTVELYDTREQVYTTLAVENPKQTGEVLTVQAREGLNIGLAVSVRYRLDPRRLDTIHKNLPQPVGEEVVAPVVTTIYRQLAPNYVTREIFATRREELRSKAAQAITDRLASDGILVREVLLRDLRLPQEYAKGLEGLLLKEQENEQLTTDQEIKLKQVRIAELEAEALKAREVKQAEGQAQVHVLQAKAEADAMQYTLPLKQKQIEQSKLEAQARKEATLQNAEAAAQAKIIDSKAELERQRNLSDAEANRIRVTAAADSERLKFEAAVLKSNPMLIQKIIAERLSDKLQIMMVPTDGRNFFASDVMRSAFSGVNSANSDSSDEGSAGDPPVVAQRKPPRRP